MISKYLKRLTLWTYICSLVLGPIIFKGSPVYKCVYVCVYVHSCSICIDHTCLSFLYKNWHHLCILFWIFSYLLGPHGNPCWSPAIGHIHPFAGWGACFECRCIGSPCHSSSMATCLSCYLCERCCSDHSQPVVHHRRMM